MTSSRRAPTGAGPGPGSIGTSAGLPAVSTELGWVHSVEAWDARAPGRRPYGVAIGGLFAGESMFHWQTDASKVALVGLVQLSRRCRAGRRGRLLDVQWATPHLVSLGRSR